MTIDRLSSLEVSTFLESVITEDKLNTIPSEFRLDTIREEMRRLNDFRNGKLMAGSDNRAIGEGMLFLRYLESLAMEGLKREDVAGLKPKVCLHNSGRTVYKEFNEMTDAYQYINRCDKCGAKI